MFVEAIINKALMKISWPEAQLFPLVLKLVYAVLYPDPDS
jgi:hypothetical protein